VILTSVLDSRCSLHALSPSPQATEATANNLLARVVPPSSLAPSTFKTVSCEDLYLSGRILRLKLDGTSNYMSVSQFYSSHDQRAIPLLQFPSLFLTLRSHGDFKSLKI
jgi:hypothetical protein